MRLLFVIPSYKPAVIYGGTTVVVSELAEGLARQGHEVTVYSTTANGKEELAVEPGKLQVIEGVNVYYFSRITGDHTHISPALYKALWKNIRHFDVVHIHSWWSILVIVSALICKLKRIKPVISPHGMLSGYTFETQNSLTKALVHWLFGKSLLRNSYLHACTMPEWKESLEVNPAWEGFIASNLIKLPGYVERHSEQEILQLAFLSRIDPKKGLDILFYALAKVKFPFVLNIAGSGEESYLNELRSLAKSLGLEERINWAGWKKGDNKFKFLAQNDIFILPSKSENFAIAAIEALACGTPVVLSHEVGISEYVAEKELGWICEADSVVLSALLETVYYDKKNRKRIEIQAPGQVRKDFEHGFIVSLYTDFYENTFAKPNKRELRILQVSASYKPAYIYGGPIISVSGLCEALTKKHYVEVYTTTANGIAELDVNTGMPQKVDGVKVTYFKRYTKDHSHFSPMLIINLIRHVRSFDLVHIHAWWNTVSVSTCLISLIMGVPVVFSPRGTLSRYSFTHNNVLLKKIFFTPARMLLKHTAFHVTSAKEKEDIVDLLKPGNISIIPNLIKISARDHAVSLLRPVITTNSALKMIFLSRIDEKKGLELLFDVLSEVNWTWTLSIAGLGQKEYIENLKTLAISKRIKDRIIWLGFLDHHQKFNALQQHDLFILPSYDENFANAVLESLSVGTAVLISKNVGLADVVEREKLGWTFKRTKAALMENLGYIASHKEEFLPIRQRGPLVVSEQFNESVLISQYLDMYREAIEA